MSHFWTLAVEEHFYLFWPFVVGLLPRTTVMRICVVLSFVSLALRVAAHFAQLNIYYAHVLTPCLLDSLCAGSWLALAARGPGGLDGLAGRAAPILTFATLGILATSLWHARLGGEGTVSEALRDSFLALFFGWTIVLAGSERGPHWLKSALRTRWLRWLGKYSYGLYVFHGIVAYYFSAHQTLTLFTQLTGSRTAGFFLQALVGAAFSTLVAVLSYELFEVHFLRLKKFFSGSVQRPKAMPVNAPPPSAD